MITRDDYNNNINPYIQKALQEDSLQKASKGEGSRGGKVIGHTRSGKPIYAGQRADDYSSNFSEQDHRDAASLHQDHAQKLKNKSNLKTEEAYYKNQSQIRMHNLSAGIHDQRAYASRKEKDHPVISKMIEKGGEGSKGGKVIGHTKSGKPIYQSSHYQSNHKDFSKEDHKDAHELHSKLSKEAAKEGRHSDSEHHKSAAKTHKTNAESTLKDKKSSSSDKIWKPKFGTGVGPKR